jgi:hypothetical protein
LYWSYLDSTIGLSSDTAGESGLGRRKGCSLALGIEDWDRYHDRHRANRECVDARR